MLLLLPCYYYSVFSLLAGNMFFLCLLRFRFSSPTQRFAWMSSKGKPYFTVCVCVVNYVNYARAIAFNNDIGSYCLSYVIQSPFSSAKCTFQVTLCFCFPFFFQMVYVSIYTAQQQIIRLQFFFSPLGS